MTAEQRPKVLVVDDRKENRTAMEAILADLDVEMLEAASGDDALALVLEHEFAVVLMDVQMPGMDGFETVSLLRQHRRTQHLPVVFVTAISTEGHFVSRGYEVGAVDYLFKPVDPEILRSKVRVFVQLYQMKTLLEEKNAELEQMAHELHEATLRDPLTGLRNRRFVTETIGPELAIARRLHADRATDRLREGINTDVGFLMADVDHFKRINDRYGHEAGDRVLVELAGRLTECIRECDSLVRWGGEEFLIMLRRTDPDGLPTVAERIRSRINGEPFTLSGDTTIPVTCSIGFCRYPVCGGDSFSWDEIVAVADKALYLAKERGRNTWVGVEDLQPATTDSEKRPIMDSSLDEAAGRGLIRLSTPSP